MLQKARVHLFGKYCHRTPLFYTPYRAFFDKSFQYETHAEKADFLVTGFVRDFEGNADEISHLLKKNPDLKLVVLSEEPFWDTVWSPGFQNSESIIRINENGKETIFRYQNLNHVTSSIFDFENIPYFVTTSDDYFVRYNKLFSRNAEWDATHYKALWENARWRYAFFAARRIGKNFEVRFDRESIRGLNRYRSHICEGLKNGNVLREGKGWGSNPPRQTLSDWHDDKLSRLDGHTFITSGLENTHLKTYVSEKIFDAFAVQAVPLYYAESGHDIFRLAEKESFINLAGLTVRQALKRIKGFHADKTFIEQYIMTQKRMNELFKDPKYLFDERQRVVHEVLNAFMKIM